MTKTIPAEIARELLWAQSAHGITRVAITDDDTGRWVSYHTLVVQFDDTPDKFFATEFEQGLTESQYTVAFEYVKEVEFKEVEPYEVSLTFYREVKG